MTSTPGPYKRDSKFLTLVQIGAYILAVYLLFWYHGHDHAGPPPATYTVIQELPGGSEIVSPVLK